MSGLVKSEITGCVYFPQKTVRIVNLAQNMQYLTWGCRPVDIYVSNDYKTGKPILVFLYDKQDSYKYYQKWCTQKENKDEQGISEE